jgi:25S rRNA (uracil2634-N3)-methyltransferase
VYGFFANAWHLLQPYGEIHLSHKTGFPYDAWDIEQLAFESCLIMVRKVVFSKKDYPGYNQKRGDSATCDQPFALGHCCTFMFCIGDAEMLKQARENRVGSISSCLGDNKFYPGIWATGMRPFDLNPLAPAWPQPHFPPVNRVHMPIEFDPCPFGLSEMEHPVHCYCTSFYYQDMIQSMCSGPPLNVFPSQSGFDPPMGSILSTTFVAHWEQPWYQEGPPIEPPWTPQEHQNLQREYEIHRQLTLSLEHRYMESVERWARLEMLIQAYGGQ